MTIQENWCLIGRVADDEPARRIPIWGKPFTVGRGSSAVLHIRNATVSRQHAEITQAYGALWLRDLKSTNGTCVNGELIDRPLELKANDLLQFGEVVFRIERSGSDDDDGTIGEDVGRRAVAFVQFHKILSDKQITPYFQPIVNLENNDVIGFEALARSDIPGLENPDAMFRAASQLGLERELSVVLRSRSASIGKLITRDLGLFLNSHPLESYDELAASMAELRRNNPDRKLTLELHEATIGDLPGLRILHRTLRDLNVQLAFDDFGAGHERLCELIESPPDYLKFDISVIGRIDHASSGKHKTIEALAKMAIDVGAQPLAEGVETAEEAETCRQLGFAFAQGYYFGRPSPIESFDNVLAEC